MVARLLEGPRIRQQAVARAFVDRFRAMQNESPARPRLARLDRPLPRARAVGPRSHRRQRDGAARVAARPLPRDAARVRHCTCRRRIPEWLANLDGDRPPLSIDIVGEFLLPVVRQDQAAAFIVIDCLRLDQWKVLEPVIATLFDIETTHYFGVLPTATPYARNALFSGLFPNEIAARFPDWWGEREDETLNAHERELLEAQLVEIGHRVPVKYDKISTSHDADELERRLANAIAPEGISAFVFNFVDLLTHGRSESAILYEVARDEIALRQLTLQWFRRSALFSVLQEAARRKVKVLVTSDHGSIHCHTPATVFAQARRDAEPALQVRRGPARRESGARAAVHERGLAEAAAPRPGREHAARHRRQLLRLSDEAARVPEPLPRLVPARRRDAGGVHPARCRCSPRAGSDVSSAAALPAPALVADGRDDRVQRHRRRARRVLVHAARPVPRTRCSARRSSSPPARELDRRTSSGSSSAGSSIPPTASARWRR